MAYFFINGHWEKRIWYAEPRNPIDEKQAAKERKARQIGCNTIQILIKQRMKELGCEYRMHAEERNNRLQLAVKLQKKRMLKVSFPMNNVELAKSYLTQIEEYVKAIDSIPMNFRIANQGNGMKWDKEG